MKRLLLVPILATLLACSSEAEDTLPDYRPIFEKYTNIEFERKCYEGLQECSYFAEKFLVAPSDGYVSVTYEGTDNNWLLYGFALMAQDFLTEYQMDEISVSWRKNTEEGHRSFEGETRFVRWYQVGDESYTNFIVRQK